MIKLKSNKLGITLVEIIIYIFIFGVIGGGVYEGYLFFFEWKCNQNIYMMNDAVEQYITESRKPLTSIEDVIPYMKGKKLPHCDMCPKEAPYLLDPVERKVRCPYHGF